MKKIKLLAICLLAGTFASSRTVFAERDKKGGDRDHKKGPRGGGNFEERFTAMDADKSGEISKAEFEAAHAKRMERMKEHIGDKFDPAKAKERGETFFGKMDADSSGSITKEEMKKGFAGMRDRKGGPGHGDRDHKGKGHHKKGDRDKENS